MSHARQRPDDPDAGTLDACRRGDRSALETVLRSQLPVLERLLTRLVGPGADLEDLLQNTLIAAVSAFPRFRGEASVRTWLCRIAVHVVHEHLRRPARRRRVSLELLPADADVDRSPGPDRVAAGRRRLERIYYHLDRLGPPKRIAFVLHVLEGRPIEEVAALMGASRMATKSRVFWARRELLRHAHRDPELRDALEETP